MSSIRYSYKKPNLKQFKELRNSADWNLEQRGISEERASMSLKESPLCITAFDGKKIIGMVRLSGDLNMYGYIQDTIVIPEYQGKGIGSKMMEMIMARLENKMGYLLGVCPSKVSVEFY